MVKVDGIQDASLTTRQIKSFKLILKEMKKLSAFFIGVLLTVNIFTATAKEDQKDPFMTRTFPAASIKSVEVITSGGRIAVNGDTNSEAVVEVYANHNKWSDEKIKQVLEENYTIEIKVESGKLHALARPKANIKNWKTQGLNISFKISVPRQIDSHLRTSGGSIQLNDLSGSQDFTTSGGSLSVKNVSGNIVGRTSGGSIVVTNSKDNIDLKTSGGSITATNCEGKIDIATAGGSLRMSNLSGNINAITSGGSITASNINGIFKTSTAGGSITATNCEGTINMATAGGSLKMSNLNGNINAATSGGSITASNVNGVFKTGTSGGSMQLENISGSLEAKTSGGSMNVAMTSVSDYVKLSNNGNINLTVPADKGYNLKVDAKKIKTSGLKDFSGNMDNGSIGGIVGSGNTEIEIKALLQVNLSFK